MTVYDDEQSYRTHMHRVCVREMAYEWGEKRRKQIPIGRRTPKTVQLVYYKLYNIYIYICIALKTTALGFR